jgi:hypothetical protein
MLSPKEKKEVSKGLIKETKHEAIILSIASVQFLLIEKYKDKIPWLESIISAFPLEVHGFCTFMGAYILVIFETLILTRIKSNIFFISRRTAIAFAILIVIVGFINTALAFQHHISDLEIAIQVVLIVLSAVAVWKASTIPEDKIFLKSLMTTIPAASLGVAAILAGSLILAPQIDVPPIIEPRESHYDQNIEHHYNQDDISHSDPDYPRDIFDKPRYYSDSIYLSRNAKGYIPPDYYSLHSLADVDSITELNRFIEAAKTGNFDNLKRVAFLEWFLKIHGFNVSFVRSNNFNNMSQVHIWLLYRNRQGDKIPIEPRVKEFGAFESLPILPEFKSYEKEYKDIYELSNNTGGALIYSWWDETIGKQLLNHT